jgi:hypothetical protein
MNKSIYRRYATSGGKYELIVYMEPGGYYSYITCVNSRQDGGGSGFTGNNICAVIDGIIHNAALDGIHYREVSND